MGLLAGVDVMHFCLCDDANRVDVDLDVKHFSRQVEATVDRIGIEIQTSRFGGRFRAMASSLSAIETASRTGIASER